MKGWVSILFEPLSTQLYKWKGEFSPQTRGPQAYAESKPVPLPSTIAGLLAGQLSTPKCSGAVDEVERVLAEKLGEDFRLRGPYIYAEWSEDSGRRVKALCTVLGGESLYCIDVANPEENVKIELPAVQHVGIALDSLSRTVIEGYMYTVRMADVYTAIARLAMKPHDGIADGRLEKLGILVEMYGDTDSVKQLEGRTVWMGARQKPYRVLVLDDTPARTLASKTPQDTAVTHIVSPILLCGNEAISYTVEAGLEEKLYSQLLDKMAAKPWGVAHERVCERVVFSVLGRGYDLCLSRKRPYCQAVTPGVQLRVALSVSPLEFYEEGIGSYRRLGWGTVLPLPPTLWACRSREDNGEPSSP